MAWVKRPYLAGACRSSALQPWAGLPVYCLSQPLLPALLPISEEGAGYRAVPGLGPEAATKGRGLPRAKQLLEEPPAGRRGGQATGGSAGSPPLRAGLWLSPAEGRVLRGGTSQLVLLKVRLPQSPWKSHGVEKSQNAIKLGQVIEITNKENFKTGFIWGKEALVRTFFHLLVTEALLRLAEANKGIYYSLDGESP